jgi:hypothetical protein
MPSDPEASGEFVAFECERFSSGVGTPAEAKALAFDLLGAATEAEAERKAAEMVEECEGTDDGAGAAASSA